MGSASLYLEEEKCRRALARAVDMARLPFGTCETTVLDPSLSPYLAVATHLLQIKAHAASDCLDFANQRRKRVGLLASRTLGRGDGIPDVSEAAVRGERGAIRGGKDGKQPCAPRLMVKRSGEHFARPTRHCCRAVGNRGAVEPPPHVGVRWGNRPVGSGGFFFVRLQGVQARHDKTPLLSKQRSCTPWVTLEGAAAGPTSD